MRDLEFCETSQNFSSMEHLLLNLGHVTNQIQIKLVRWGVTNLDVLLLTTIWLPHFFQKMNKTNYLEHLITSG